MDNLVNININQLATFKTRTMFLGCCYLTDENRVRLLDGIFPSENKGVLLEIKRNGKAGKRIEINLEEFRELLDEGKWKLISNLKPMYVVDIGSGKRKVNVDWIS